MKKRVVSVLMIIVLLAGALSVSALAASSLSNFSKINTYNDQFKDVSSSQWYADEVKMVYEYGLINGITATTFEPGSYLKINEAIKLAAVLHSIYNTGTSTLQSGSPDWYQPYVDYALENGIIPSEYANYEAYATRSDFAMIFANAFPEEALSAINNITTNSIPDVSYAYSYGPAVYMLYRAGILTGSGDNHAFHPNDSIKRSEVAAIVARMASSSFRIAFSVKLKELTSTEVAAQCSPAVFYIVVYNAQGQAFASGSGFFINNTGLAVTNFHVIEGASSATIMTTDNEIYDVAGVYDYNEDYDLALLQIDGDGFPFLPVGDSNSVLTGATVYAIGNPQGLTSTFTEGGVSNAARQFSDSPVRYIQFDASISAGSSGGALINTLGAVIGVTTATIETGQNLNLAVPINLIDALSTDSYYALTTAGGNQFSGEITLSKTNVAVSVYNVASVTVTDVLDNADSVSYTVSDSSVVGCRWGEWTNNYTQIALGIKGLSPGSSTITVYLLDTYDSVLATAIITVTVTEGTAPAVRIYSNYYPVVDLGAYENVGLFDQYTANNIMYYAYRADAFFGNLNDVFTSYGQLLVGHGFVYDGAETSNGGYVYDYYSSSTWHVAIGMFSYNGMEYVQVIVY